MSPSRNARGQATVELALAIVFLAVLLLLIVQIGLVARDQVLVTQAAREGARAAAVDPAPGAAAIAATRATGLTSARMKVSSSEAPGGMKQVEVRFRSRVAFPVGNRTLLEPELKGRAAMRSEY